MSMTMAARQARSLAHSLRLSSSNTQPVSSRGSQLVQNRGFSADHHGTPKVNFWEDPMSPSKWKEEHICLPRKDLRKSHWSKLRRKWKPTVGSL